MLPLRLTHIGIMSVRLTHSYAMGPRLTKINITSVRLSHSCVKLLRLTHVNITYECEALGL